MVAVWRFENFEKMKNRPLPLAVRLIFLALPAFAAQAAEGTGSPEQRADWEQRFSKAKALSAEGHARREEAAKIRDAKDAECPKRFQVNACLKENSSEFTKVDHQAQRLENEAQAIERQVRKEQLAEKDAGRKADAARRQAELPELESETAAAQQKAEDRETRIRASKAVKAEAGMQRKAANAEKQRQRQAAHEARVAEKMKKAQENTDVTDAPGK